MEVSGLWLTVQRRGLLGLGALGRRRGPEHLRVGVRGEFEALFALRRAGYTVVERRWRTPELNGDVDLIAWDGDTLAFAEVKTRTARDRTPARAAVDEAKRRMLRRMAQAFVRTLPREERDGVVVRFDVVSVYLLGGGVECEILREAFDAD